MEIQREALLGQLNFSKIGLSCELTLEQSNTFVHTKDGRLVTFNDEVFTSQKSPFTGLKPFSVIGRDLLELLQRIPDEVIDLSLKDSELIIKAKRKSAGITAQEEILLPYAEVPEPKKWTKLEDGFSKSLLHAAGVASTDISEGVLAYVHVTPEMIESCDNARLIRIKGKTGLSKEVLLPASASKVIGGLPVSKISVGEGWAHFGITSDQIISIRCSHEEFRSLDGIILMKESNKVEFPEELPQIIRRAGVFLDIDRKVEIKIESGLVSLVSRKETGWYKEKKKIEYKGETLEFSINADTFLEMLSQSATVRLQPGRKIKIEANNIVFMTVIPVKEEVEKKEE